MNNPEADGNNIVFKIPRARLSWGDLIKPKPYVDPQTGAVSDPKYSANFIVDPVAHGQVLQDLSQIITNVGRLRYPAFECHTNEMGVGTPLNNGDHKPEYDGYPGNWIVVSSSPATQPAPGLFDNLGSEVDRMELQRCAEMFYGGAQVLGIVQIFLHPNKVYKIVCAKLIAVQFIAHDTPFGAATPDVSGMLDSVPGAVGPGAPGTVPGVPVAPGIIHEAPVAPGIVQPTAGQPLVPGQPVAPPPGGLPGRPPFLK